MRSTSRESEVAAAWSRVDLLLTNYTEEDGPLDTPCWIWQGATHGKYGMYHGNRRSGWGKMHVHRAMFIIWNSKPGHINPIPSGFLIRHGCDTPLCYQPLHLELGTYQQNMDDKIDRGRLLIGEEVGNSIYTAEEVANDLALYLDDPLPGLIAEIARRRNRNTKAIYDVVVQRRTWKHIEPSPNPTMPTTGITIKRRFGL